MSAERMPRLDSSILAGPIGWLTQVVLRAPRAVVAGALALAMISALLAALCMNFRTSRLDLLNPESAYNKLWLEYIDRFGDDDDLVLVVSADDPTAIVAAMDDLAHELNRRPQFFQNVLHKVDLRPIRAKKLHFLSLAQLQRIEAMLNRIDPILHDDWSDLNLGRQAVAMLDHLERAGASRSGVRTVGFEPSQLDEITAELAAALAGHAPRQAAWDALDAPASFQPIGSEYRLAGNGRFGFVVAHLVDQGNQIAKGTAAIDSIRRVLPEVRLRHPEVEIGLTGLPVMENDEMRASQTDMLRASVASLFGVSVLFIAGFGGLRHPLLTVASLLVAMAWSFGYVTLGVGHLNILSISFGVILIGLGIDFGIHYVARYLEVLPDEGACEPALVRAGRTIGPGIVTGGVTTALAFFSAVLTHFTGVVELGIIAGGGILLCIVAALVVLPAMIAMADAGHQIGRLPRILPVDRWVGPASRFPRAALFASAAITLLLAAGSVSLRYDHNLLNLQPPDLESVRWERKIISESDESVWYAVSIARTREELLARKARFERLPNVDRTEDVISHFPDDDPRRRTAIAGVSRRLAALPDHVPLIPVVEPAELHAKLSAALRNMDPADAPGVGRIAHIRDMLSALSPTECYVRLSTYQQRAATDLLGRLHALRSMADPEPPSLSDLPEAVRARFVGRDNQHLLRVYAKADIWDIEALEGFVHQVKQIDPQATGKPLQTYYASLQMQRSYIHAAIYALIAVAIVLLIDFRRVRYTLLAMAPMLLGLVQLFGVLALLDIPLNPANMIVLPLILGIGIDDGVHVVHDFRRQSGRYRLGASTAAAVLLTSLTTMVGFGSLMLASHEGLRSLGRVLTIGVCCCLLTSLIMLPALLTWITRGRSEPIDEAV